MLSTAHANIYHLDEGEPNQCVQDSNAQIAFSGEQGVLNTPRLPIIIVIIIWHVTIVRTSIFVRKSKQNRNRKVQWEPEPKILQIYIFSGFYIVMRSLFVLISPMQGEWKWTHEKMKLAYGEFRFVILAELLFIIHKLLPGMWFPLIGALAVKPRYSYLRGGLTNRDQILDRPRKWHMKCDIEN